MLNTKEVIQTVNNAISKNKLSFYNSIIVSNQDKPNYNNGQNSPYICQLKLDECNKFYSELKDVDVCEKTCPFGFLVCKKSFNTASNYEKISVFSIVKKIENKSSLISSTNVHRNVKPLKNKAIEQLNNLVIDEPTHRQRKNYIEGLVETLLIGRIGLAIQSISHQFFTPLQGAMSDVKNLDFGEDNETANRLTKNFNELNILATQIQLILSTSQEFNTNMLRRVTIHNMINDIYSSLQTTATEKKLVLKQGYNNASKTIEAIPNQLYIALSNVIQNAIKYSYNGLADRFLEITTEYKLEDDFLIISITNEGCKITEEEIRERLIFNLSYRGIHSLDRQRTGTGSGLYVSNEIVKVHSGRIDVESNICGGSSDQGTSRYKNEFHIKWPIYID
jgi:signal transduction histidine kinase